MLTAAIVLAIVAALIEWFIGGIRDPWRKIVIAGVVILFVLGLIALIFPGVLPIRVGWY